MFLDLEIPPPGRWNPLVALAAIWGDDPKAGPGEVESEGAFVGERELGKDLFAGGDGGRWVVVEVDEPIRVFEHQYVMVGKVRDVEERLAVRLNAENRMPVGVAGSGDQGNSAIEDLISVLMDHEIRLQRVECIADVLNHLLDVIGAVRL